MKRTIASLAAVACLVIAPTASATTAAPAAYTVTSPVTATALATYSIDQGSVVNPLLPQVQQTNIYNTIKHLSTNWPNRYYSTNNAKQAAAWIRDQEVAYSAGRTDVTTELNTTACSNCGGSPLVIHTIKGTSLPNEYVVIGGHYDSTVGTTATETTVAPGADDNASSQGTMLEALRVLHAAGWKPQRTVVFMSYPAEEVGLYGSKAAATLFKNQGKNVVGALNLDMTNYRSATPSGDIALITDNTSAALNTHIKSLGATYLPTMKFTSMNCGYQCSDHAPWTNAGYPSSALAEPDLFPKLHTAGDTLANMGNTAQPSVKFAQLSIAFLVETGKTEGTDNPAPDPILSNGIPVPGLSASTGNQKYYAIDIPASSSNLKVTTTGGTGDLDLYLKAGAKPTTTVADCKSTGSSSTETCTVAAPVAGRYYVLLSAYSTYSGVTLTASYTTGGSSDKVLVKGVPVSVSGASGSSTYYTVNLTATAPTLTIKTSGGTGDLDLYVRTGGTPTTTSYTCRPYRSGNAETCTLSNVPAGTVGIMLKGYSSYSGASLVATW